MAATNIAQEVTRLTTAKADLKTAIEGKGVTVPSSTLLDGYAALVDQIQQGGAEEAPENDVNFYDYDGRRIASYTIAEAKALTALPTPPQHDGLTFEEWNWSLADIQAYDRQYINVGANYKTNDELTHILVVVPSDVLEVKLSFGGYNGTMTLDWGDGSATETQSFSTLNWNTTLTFTHAYSSAGEYWIKISYTGFARGFKSKNTNLWSGHFFKEIRLGEDFGNHNNVAELTYFSQGGTIISIPKSRTVFNYFLNSHFKAVCFPKNDSFSFAALNSFSGFEGQICFPKQIGTWTSTGTFGRTMTSRLILPHTTSSTLPNSLFGTNYCVRILSLPNIPLQIIANANYWNLASVLQYIDVPQGYIPSQNLLISQSECWSAQNLVKFFTRLGTTQTAITLTFGSTNLNKLTAEEKAIATNKGYTLA